MTDRASAATFAYTAITMFILGMAMAISQAPPATFSGPPPLVVVVMCLAFTAWHLLLLPVVAALDAPAWAKGSGYAWIAIDNVIVFLSYFGVAADLVVPMRWGVHLACATWIIGASESGQGAMRWAGRFAAGSVTLVSFIGPFVGVEKAPQTLGPAALFLILWVVLAGRTLATKN